MLKNNFIETYSRHTGLINYLFIGIIFSLNFLALPQLKFVYLCYIVFAFTTAALMDLKTSLLIILTFSFLEGQGRILWNYHPFVRIAFDLLVATALIHSLVVRRELNTLKSLPRIVLLFMVLHFIWYLVEMFNPNAVSIFSAIAATKIYLFPILLFLVLRNSPDAFEESNLSKLVTLLFVIIVLESILSLYQGQKLESSLLSISSNYQTAIKDIFVSKDFRPFGTAFLPGVIAVYLFLTTGFLFLKKEMSRKRMLLILLTCALVALTILSAQVRSALVKYIVILLGCLFSLLICSPLSMDKKIIRMGQFIIALIIVGLTGYYLAAEHKIINLDSAIGRWKTVTSYEKFKSGRAGPEMAFTILKLRLSEFPIGLGPGVTGAASSVSREAMDRDPIYNRNTFWGYDNLFLSLVVEFGYGSIFYILLILSLPLVVLKRGWRTLRAGKNYEARVCLIAFFQISVIILGNWGAIGLPYNPESFFFWFWGALALNISEDHKA